MDCDGVWVGSNMAVLTNQSGDARVVLLCHVGGVGTIQHLMREATPLYWHNMPRDQHETPE